MNSLIINAAECVEPLRAELHGSRALYAYDTHGLREGHDIKVAIYGGQKGYASVTEASKTKISLALRELHDAVPCHHLDLIVGLSRPQTVKKVIQAATILGARSLQEQVVFEITKGLEQVWEALPPQVFVHRTFSFFSENHLPTLLDPFTDEERMVCSLVAHPGGQRLSELLKARRLTRTGASVVIAIGPERGWSDREVSAFISAGFLQVGLGARVMRVELAVVFLCGQLQALELIR
jgi:16S rRNA (uracil1498-N3)-methyltransferase